MEGFTFDEVKEGAPPQDTSTKAEGYTFEEAKPQDFSDLSQGSTWDSLKTWGSEVGTSLKNVAKDYANEPGKMTGKAIANVPKVVVGAVEAGAGVVAGMGLAAGGGMRGLWDAIAPEAIGGGNKQTFLQNFQSGLESVLGPASEIPFSAETDAGKYLESVLGLVPEGIHVAGNTVFEKTGSALAGAGTEGMATLLMFKPDAATKILKDTWGKKTDAGKQVTDAFDKMAEEEPWNARMTADKVTDKQLKADLNKRIDEILVKKQDVADAFKSVKSPTEVTQTDLNKIFNKDNLEKKPAEQAPIEDTVVGSNGRPEPVLNNDEVLIRSPLGDRVEPTLEQPAPKPKEPDIGEPGWVPGAARGVDLGAEIRKIEEHLAKNKEATEAEAKQSMASVIQQSAALNEAAGPYTDLASGGREVWKLPSEKTNRNAMTEAFLEASQSKGYQSQRFKQMGVVNLDMIDTLARQTLAIFDRLPDLARLNVATIRDTLKQQDIRGAERDIVTKVLEEMGNPKDVDAKEFATKVGEKLTPVYLSEHGRQEYADYGMGRIGYSKADANRIDMPHRNIDSIGAPETHIWETPIQTPESGNHFYNPNYMAHSRVMDQPGKVRSIIEVQSDLFQHQRVLKDSDKAMYQNALSNIKDAYDAITNTLLDRFRSTSIGREERMIKLHDAEANRINNAMEQFEGRALDNPFSSGDDWGTIRDLRDQLHQNSLELEAKLQGGNIKSELTPMAKHWYERVLREENALAARDGKQRLRLATADTVAKVEGVGADHYEQWRMLSVVFGQYIMRMGELFKIVFMRIQLEEMAADSLELQKEHQGIYNRYKRELEPFAAKEFGAKTVTDKQGNTWLEWTVDPKAADARVHVFGGGKKPTATAGSNAGTLYSGIPLTPENIAKAFTFTREQLRKIPQYRTFENEITTSIDQAIRAINPEALGKHAKEAAAIIAKNVSEQMQRDSSYTTKSQPRRGFWEKNKLQADQFIDRYEKGTGQPTRELQRAENGYRQWNDEILAQDQAAGLKYDPQDNYLYHVFKDGKGVADFMQKRYGSKWNDPNFIKERAFDLYSDAKKFGFEPKFTNPEDIMLLRQHASDIATMRVQTLRDMEQYGLARKVVKGERSEPGEVEWRSPNGQRYWVQPDASQLLHNAFNTKSLWNLPGVVGSTFRTAMWLKNIVVPIRLALSAFHPLHVATIDNATTMVRATKGLLAGTESAPQLFLKGMLEGVFYKDLVKETGSSLAGPWKDAPSGGYRLLNVWKGKVPDSQLTAADKTSLQLMTEGGFIPEMSAQYKNASVKNFTDAIRTRSISGSLFHLPFAMLETMNKPMFEIWIPSLKIASYLKDVKTAMKADPSLAGNPMKRQLAFRAIAKSVDNRYGEMAYNTLFWNRWVKDIAVGSSLSLGWNLGFLREYGGAGLDIAGELAKGTSLKDAATRGKLDRALFVGFYSAQAMAYGGLLTWALTGQSPTSLLDYIYPKSGEKNPDGSDARLNTMFYPREFASIGLHMKRQGVASGLGHLVLNKASPVLGLAADWATNVDYFGKEISDPSAPAYKRLEQKLAYTFKNLEPMSMASAERANLQGWKRALPYLGFSPAPSYVTESNTQAAVKAAFRTYAKAVTPFERAEYGEDATKLHNAMRNGDHETYRTTLVEMKQKYHLSPEQIVKLRKGANSDPTLKMFKALPAEIQTRLLKDMDEDDLKTYLPQAQGKVRHQHRMNGR